MKEFPIRTPRHPPRQSPSRSSEWRPIPPKCYHNAKATQSASVTAGEWCRTVGPCQEAKGSKGSFHGNNEAKFTGLLCFVRMLLRLSTWSKSGQQWPPACLFVFQSWTSPCCSDGLREGPHKSGTARRTRPSPGLEELLSRSPKNPSHIEGLESPDFLLLRVRPLPWRARSDS